MFHSYGRCQTVDRALLIRGSTWRTCARSLWRRELYVWRV